MLGWCQEGELLSSGIKIHNDGTGGQRRESHLKLRGWRPHTLKWTFISKKIPVGSVAQAAELVISTHVTQMWTRGHDSRGPCQRPRGAERGLRSAISPHAISSTVTSFLFAGRQQMGHITSCYYRRGRSPIPPPLLLPPGGNPEAGPVAAEQGKHSFFPSSFFFFLILRVFHKHGHIHGSDCQTYLENVPRGTLMKPPSASGSATIAWGGPFSGDRRTPRQRGGGQAGIHTGQQHEVPHYTHRPEPRRAQAFPWTFPRNRANRWLEGQSYTEQYHLNK